MKKHAYLIMTHSSFNILQALISAIEDIRNDIYIHIDKKADVDVNSFHVEHIVGL